MGKNEISPRMKKMLEKGRAEARKRVIERGVVQFRADPNMMQELLEISENRRIPLGTMLREWITYRLRQEHNSGERQAANEARLDELSKRLEELESSLLYAIAQSRSLLLPSADFYAKAWTSYPIKAQDRFSVELERLVTH